MIILVLLSNQGQIKIFCYSEGGLCMAHRITIYANHALQLSLVFGLAAGLGSKTWNALLAAQGLTAGPIVCTIYE